MAKSVKCGFCGKEINLGGLFSKSEGEEGNILDFGDKFNEKINCCMDCYNEYHEKLNTLGDRFKIKVSNLAANKANRRTSEDYAVMLKWYYEEKEQNDEKTKDIVLTDLMGCFITNEDGYFAVREVKKDKNADINYKQKVKSLEEASEYLQGSPDIFNKNDITKIEYAVTGYGEPLNLFTRVYKFYIRLNDETILTFKPCLTKYFATGHGFAFGYYRSAEKKLLNSLNDFKSAIGSDLPIVKVKKI